MKKIITLFIGSLLLFFATSCNRSSDTANGYTSQQNYYYKLLAIGDGKIKPDTADHVWIDASCFTLKDSLFWDTRHEAGQRFFVRMKDYCFSPHLFTLAEGDSVQYLVPTVKFFNEFFGFDKAADFCNKDTCVKLSVKILGIISADEYAHIGDSLMALAESRKNEEYAQIYNYVTANFKGSLQLSSDAFMQITEAGSGDTVQKGDRVSLLYKASFLDGRAADISAMTKPFEFTMGQEGQVIDGLALALYHLKKGGKAKIILPSRLAFGSRGSSNGSIAPYTPLLYEVQVVDVKK